MPLDTVEQIEDFLDQLVELKERAIPLLNYLAQLDGKDSRFGFDTADVEFDQYEISATWDNYRCGESDYRRVAINPEDLLNPEFEKELKERYDEEMRIQREYAVREQKKRDFLAQQKRLEQYQKLKAEFEDPAGLRSD